MEYCENPVRINRRYTLHSICSISYRTGLRKPNPRFAFEKSQNVDRIVIIGEGGTVFMRNDTDNFTKIEFVAFITLKDGRRIYAREYGMKAFPIRVRKNKDD